jgi:hypothetical protein
MGRTGQPAVILGTASLLVAVAGITVALTRGEGPVAKAPTTVAAVRHAVMVSAAGVAVPVRRGERVPNGDVVRTARNGSVQLTTRGRTVYVGPAAALAVIDGAHQQLRTGSAVVDAQHGSGLQIDVAGDKLAVPDGSAVEATRSVSVVVGSLAGSSAITNSSARRLTIPRLTQAAINGDALPAATTPLHLTAALMPTLAQVVPTLVDDDQALKTLASGIDQSGASTAQVIESAWHGTPTSTPGPMPQSDRVLPIVIASAARTGGGSVQSRYDRVVDWRRAGGSWGVVVELLSSHASAVEATLASLERGQPAGHLGTLAVQALTRTQLPGAGNQPGGNDSPNPGSSTGPTPNGPSPTTGPTGSGGSPSPSPSPDTVNKVVNTVNGVVTQVTGLLPKKPPTPHPSKHPGGLLGGLLGQ